MLNSEALINKLQADNRLLRIENEKLKHLLSNIEHRGMNRDIKLRRKQIYWGGIILTKRTLDQTKEIKVLLNQVRAFQDVVQGILDNKEAAEHSRYVSFRDMAHMYNDFANHVKAKTTVSSLFCTFNIEDMGNSDNTLWREQKKILEQVLLGTKILYATLEGNVDFVNDEFDNLENFIKTRLRTVIFDKPQKEVEVQNAIETLLLGRGLSKGTDYDRETGKFEFSGKEFIPDFIIPKLRLCIEVKLLREGKKSKVIEEISADITAYGKRYDRQLYIVYDLGCIQNEEEFKRDIESFGGVKLLTIKH